MLRVTAAIEVVLVLIGAGIGILRNPAAPAWNALGLLPFIAFNLVLGVGSRDTIARILARRRIREAAFFLLILCAALPQVLFTRGRGSPGPFPRVHDARVVARLAVDCDRGFLQGHRHAEIAGDPSGLAGRRRTVQLSGSFAAPFLSTRRPPPRARPADPATSWLARSDSSGCLPCFWAIHWARWSKRKCAS